MQRMTIHEISNAEQILGHELPGLYKKLLVEEGYGHFGKDAEIYHPSVIEALYRPFFEDPSQLFSRYFPFGCQNHTQELWVIEVETERAASIWHETVPDDWPEEEWMDYEDWVSVFLDPELPFLDSAAK